MSEKVDKTQKFESDSNVQGYKKDIAFYTELNSKLLGFRGELLSMFSDDEIEELRNLCQKAKNRARANIQTIKEVIYKL